MFYFTHIAALELISVVLLLQQLKVSLDFALLLIIELALHAGEGGLLGLLRHSTFESLALNPLLEQRNLILVVGLNGVDHKSVLHLFLLLGLFVVAFFLEKFVFLKLAGQLVHFLAEHDLLCVPLVVQGLLMRHKLLVELPLTDRLNTLLSLYSLLHELIFILLAEFAGLQLVLVLAVEGLKLLFLSDDSAVRLLRHIFSHSSRIVNLSQRGQSIFCATHILH